VAIFPKVSFLAFDFSRSLFDVMFFLGGLIPLDIFYA